MKSFFKILPIRQCYVKIAAAVTAGFASLFSPQREIAKLRWQLSQMAAHEESARAQLAQLRVHQETIAGRTGFMVSAFIPSDVLRKLNASSDDTRAAFKQHVTSVLVEHALRGIFRVSKSGTMVAMLFEPLGENSNKRVVTPVFEAFDGKHTAVRARANTYLSPDIRQLKDGGA